MFVVLMYQSIPARLTHPGFKRDFSSLKAFASIIYARPYCALNSCRTAAPRHASKPHAGEGLQTVIAVVDIAMSIHILNSVKCTVTQVFLSIDHFLS